MSVYLFVYLRNDRLPTRAAWQAAIDADNLKLKLGDFDPRDFDGFLPCQLDGIDCGFEYYFDSLDEDDQELGDRIANCDRVVTNYSWRTDARFKGRDVCGGGSDGNEWRSLLRSKERSVRKRARRLRFDPPA